MICEIYFHFLMIYESISHTFFLFSNDHFFSHCPKCCPQFTDRRKKYSKILGVEGGRGSAKWVNQGCGGSGGQMSNKPLFNTRQKKSIEQLWVGGKNAHIFNCKFVGELHNQEEGVKSTNRSSKFSYWWVAQSYKCISAEYKNLRLSLFLDSGQG